MEGIGGEIEASWKRVGSELESEVKAGCKKLEESWKRAGNKLEKVGRELEAMKERWRYVDASERTERRDVEV